MLDGFKFPNFLPQDIDSVRRVNGVQMVMNYFDTGVMPSIIDRMLSRPVQTAVNQKPGEETRKSIIRNVCSFGSCDFNNTSPSDARYGETVNRDRYNLVYFEVKLAHMRDKTTISSRMTIYDEKNNIAFDDVTDFDWAPNYDLLVRSWIIRARDGSFVKAGKYRAVFQIEDSKEYEYEFEVVTDSSPVRTNYGAGPANNNRQKEKYQRYLAYPKLFGFHLGAFFFGILALFFGVNDYVAILTIASLAAAVFMYVKLWISAYKYVAQNVIVLILVLTVGYLYFSMFLFIMSLVHIFMAKRWKQKLEA